LKSLNYHSSKWIIFYEKNYILHYFRFDEKSRLVHDIIRCVDSIEARRFVRSIYRRAHHRNQTGTVCIGQHTESTNMPHFHIVHNCVWTGRSCRCSFTRNLPSVHRKSYSTKQEQTLHSIISEIFSTIYTAEAEGTSTISWPMPNKKIHDSTEDNAREGDQTDGQEG
jgi:hypothetical protein